MSNLRRADGRGLTTFLSILAFSQIHPARGAPADIFSIPAPVIGTDPPKAADVKDGDTTVSTQTGALTYSYPFQVPPGRNGMAPQFALSYSSQAPLYGGIAAGWSLSLPEIREDTSQGRLRAHSPETELLQGSAAPADDRFVSSLAGGRPLIPVKESTSDAYMVYRAQNDTSFARYERMPAGAAYRWRIYSPDGSVMYFGDSALTKGCVNISDGFAPLTRGVDAFGNEIAYEWESGATYECRLEKVTWGQNAKAGIIQPFAQVAFTWQDGSRCSPSAIVSSALLDYRTGRPMLSGASRLVSITATAFPVSAPDAPEHTRVITLGYSETDEECTLQHAPIRLLTSIQESAWGIDAPRVDLPTVTFEYGDATVNLVNQPASGTPWPAGTESIIHRNSLSWGYRYQDDRWPSVEAMMLDVDGDGLLDRVTNASTPAVDGQCRMAWKRNLGPQFGGSSQPRFSGTEQYVTLPRLKWNGIGSSSPTLSSAGATTADPATPHFEGCSLNRQVTAYRNSYSVTGACHDGSACAASGDPGNPGPYCYPGGTECTPGAGGGPTHGEYRTYLAYRWLDMDTDGLVDLVAAVHGDIDAYDIVQGNALDNGALRAPEPWLFGGWPACPDIDRCKQIDESCIAGARTCSPGNLCTINWVAVHACAGSAPTRGCAGLIDATGPIAIAPGGNPNAGVSQAPYTRCAGLYPWFIYKNQGNGVFATTPIIKYQPVPLESDQGDSDLHGPGLTATNHAIIDFDGDGVLDAIARPRGSLASAPPTWSVWLGDRTGGVGARMYTFFTRNPPQNAINGIGLSAAQWAKSSNGLFDVNGDGLLDHFRTSDDPLLGHANVGIHDGTSFRMFGALAVPSSFGDPLGEVETPSSMLPAYAVKPGNDAIVTDASVPSPPDPPVVKTGEAASSNRVVDVDHDGRMDVVQMTVTGTIRPQVYFNVGGQFIAPGVDYPGASQDGLRRKTKMLEDVPGQSPSILSWELNANLIDLDGDGLLESAAFATGGLVRVEHPSTAPPPRILRAIHSGRGGHIYVTYASMHDQSAVEQHPEHTWSDGRPKASPQPQWVVKSVTTHDDFPHLDSTTTYFYKNPRHGADDEGQYSFRGFEEITTSAPSGARTIQRYAYASDWSGRLAMMLVVPAEAPTEVRSMTRTTWEERSLFGGAIKTYHATVLERFTCANGQTESTCTASTAPGYARTTSTLTALKSTTSAGPELLWQVTGSLVQSAPSAADGDRETVSTFALHADGTTYRLRPLTTTRSYRDGGAMKRYGKTAKTWDSTYRVALTEEVWLDTADAGRAVARSVYDMETGNVLEHWKPEQNAANSTHATFAYDSRKLFAVGEVDELGHRRDFVFDYGTGARIQTEGPNARSCTQGCPSDVLHPVRELHRVKIDGLGRPIEQWETIGDAGDIYRLVQIGTTSYLDLTTASAPTSVTSRRLIEHGGTAWTQEKTELDGHGRPIRKTVSAQGSTPSDQITTFVYRSDATLQTVSVPDPTANDASTVSYTYAFDSLGRPISIRRPDAASPASQSGIDITYDGMTRTTTEVVGAAGGSVGVTRTVHDKLGRLIEVHEQLQTTPLAWATTTYTYGPDDAVASVVDPENVTTLLIHDFAGHRTRITRHGRTWKYTYDRNGNLIAEQVPGSPKPPFTDLDYTTTIAYDDLDRPISKVIGQRNLPPSDQSLFGSRTEAFTWDGCCNRTGKLTSWRSFGPNTPTPTSIHQFSYDAQGNRIGTQHTFHGAGYANIQHQFERHANLFGGPTRVDYHDSVGGSNETKSRTYYDYCGRPARIELLRTGQPTEQIAVQARNVAGLVTRRRTDLAGPMTFVESNWTYDKLGRIASQVVRKGPDPTQIVRQDLSYFGNDDPRSLTHYLGSTSEQLHFGFDPRHQLTSVASTTAGYFNASYAYGTAGRFVRVTHAQTISQLPPGTEVSPRDVHYVYGGLDPEQVTALANVGNGTTYASYTYDTAGNQLTRMYPAIGESWDYVYDGDDQLRRATKRVNDVVQGSEEYWYDGEGQRIAILERDGAGSKTELIYFIGDTQAHHDASGAVTRVYSHLSLGTPVARIDRTDNTTSIVEYQFHGIASNTIAAVAQDGTINASFSYAPFGEVIEATNAGGPTSGIETHQRRFNDKYEGSLAKLAYYGARYYDKTSLSWTQADPLFLRVPDLSKRGSPRRANLYTFSLHNPIRFIDPDGRNPRSGDGMCVPSPTGRGCAMGGDATPAFVADVKNDTERLRQAADFTIDAVKEVTPTEDQSRVGLAIFAAFVGQPELAFAILMSGAQNHNDTVVPLIAYGMGGGGAGRRITSDSGGIAGNSGVGTEGAAAGLKHAAGDTEALAARAGQVHGALHPVAQRMRTTAVLETSGGRVVAGGGPDLTPAQRALLGPREVAARLPGAHAEVTALTHARQAGLTPQAMAVTRAICPQCAAAIEAGGGTMTSPTTALWPK